MENKKTDHDILIEVAANLNTLCKKLDKVDEDNKDEHKVIKGMINDNYKVSASAEAKIAQENTKQVEACNARFLHTKVFLWVAGFLIAGIIGSYSFTSIVQEDLKRHQIKDAKIMQDFLNHLEEWRDSKKKDVVLNATDSLSTKNKNQ